jgi:indole-3-acetate monooxygenase
MAAREPAAYIEAARNLAPQVQRFRQEIERQRSLPAALVTEMTDSGFFSLWLCRALGGPELSFVEFLQVVETLSQADGSVGWCAMVATVLSRLSGYVTEVVGREIFSPTNRLAGSVNPTGTAVPVPGGFRVTGRWSYGSFIQHSHWTVGNSIVRDGEVPRRDSNGAPDIRFMIFPTSSVEIIDNWHVSGLRGTGSCDFQVSDLFVPELHSVSAFAAKPLHSGALYSTPMITIFAATLPCVSIGIARAAIDSFVALAEAKTPMGSASRLRDKPMAQADLGRAEAQLRSGRAFLIEAVEEIWNEAAAGRTPSLRQRAIARLAAAKAAEASAQAVHLLYNAAGGSALFESNPLERCFRDVHATTQHIGTQASNFELGGRVLLGLDPGTPRF